jgi:hypothetical protein
MPDNDNPFELSEELGDELSEMIDDLFGPDEEDEPTDTPKGVSEEEGEVEAEAETETDDDYPETDVEDTVDEQVEDDEPADDEAADEVVSDEVDDVEGDGVVPSPTVTVKVNGAEREVSTDELIASYQKATAADEKFRAAAEKEREIEDYKTFAEGFAQAIKDDPASLLAEYAQLTGDPNAVIVAIVERVAAAGKLHPQLAEALGIDDRVVADARAKYAEQRAEAAEARVAQATAEQPDDWGYTQTDYQAILPEILGAAGLGAADLEAQRAFVAELAQFRAEHNIANPYLAYAQLRETRSTATAAEAAAAAAATAVSTATKRATSKKRIPAASASAGQRTAPAAPAGPIADHREAAEAAYAEIFGDN